jgi:hypothetical protein
MAVTMQDVRRWLDPEEPDYASAKAALGNDALPHLTTLATGGDLALASKAVYLASMISTPQSVAVMRAAHERHEPVLKAAVAAGIRNLDPGHAADVFELLHADPDPGIRKLALTSAAHIAAPQTLAHIDRIAQSDPEPALRRLATDVLARRPH